MFRKLWDLFRLKRHQARDRKAGRHKGRTAGQRLRVLVSAGPKQAVKAEVRAKWNSTAGARCTAILTTGTECTNRAELGDEGHSAGACFIPRHRDQVSMRTDDEQKRGRHVTP